MATVNLSYVQNEAFEMSSKSDKAEAPTKAYSYEEALDLTGNGKYNIGLLLACFMVITAMGIEIFGLGMIVTASQCDLGLTSAQVGTLSSMPFAGIIVMSYPWGYLSDTKGRKFVLMLAMTGSFISSVLSSFSPTWQVLAVLRFIGSALCSAAESATYALLGECCSSATRAKYMLLMTSALMLTPTLYYVLAYLILKLNFHYSIAFLGIVYRPWRLLALMMALPLGCGALMLHFFSESPKFLVNVGRSEEGLEVLKRIYKINNKEDPGHYPVKEIYLEEGSRESSGSWRSLWTQIAPLFKPPLLCRTLQLFYLTFVVYIANNSFAIVLPYIFNLFFTSYEVAGAGLGFCDIFQLNHTTVEDSGINSQFDPCNGVIVDNTIWAGCAHGVTFFILNALIAQCAGRRKVLTLSILVLASVAALLIDNVGDPIAGMALFFVFLTTAMIFGVISSYFVDLYPTSYRGMVACLGMMVARTSAFAGTNVVTTSISTRCSATLYGAAAIVFSGAVISYFLPSDRDL